MLRPAASGSHAMTRSSKREASPNAWRSQAAAGGDMRFSHSSDPAADTAHLRRSGIVKKLHPDQKGTRRLTERFGDRLVCVRYRTDPESGRRFTTVEILLEERKPTTPEPTHRLVRVGWKEAQLRDAVKAGGGIWIPGKKLWKVPGSTVRQLGILKRVVQESN
jgi:hypothetical protein